MLRLEAPSGPIQREVCADHVGDSSTCRNCGHPRDRHPHWLTPDQLARLNLTSWGARRKEANLP